jgi:hypothetical protein
MGAFSEATAHADEAIQIAEELDHPFSLGLAFHGAARLHLCKGDVQKTIVILERGRELCRARVVGYWLPVICASLGLAYATCGRPAEAFPLIEQALEGLPVGQRLVSIYQSLLLTTVGETYLLADRADDANQRVEEALRVSCGRGERGRRGRRLYHNEPCVQRGS